jgi:hypothetical protein
LWTDFIESLEELPVAPTYYDMMTALLTDWWIWVWQEVGINGPPLARDDVFRAEIGDNRGSDSFALTIPPNVLENDVDPENELVVALLQSGPQHGVLTLNLDGTFQYVPSEGFAGVDSFTYVAYDFSNESAAATVRIPVGFRGDYDGDHTVNGIDFLAWQQNFGQAVDPHGSGTDGDGDGVVGRGDLWAWSDNFGSAVPDTSGSPEAYQLELTAESSSAVDQVISLHASTATSVSGSLVPTNVSPDFNPSSATLHWPATRDADFVPNRRTLFVRRGELNDVASECLSLAGQARANLPNEAYIFSRGSFADMRCSDWLAKTGAMQHEPNDFIDSAFAALGADRVPGSSL